jgi:hypothetical protein
MHCKLTAAVYIRHTNQQRPLILFLENDIVVVDRLKIRLGLTSIVRAPQYRNSVFVSWTKHHPCLGALLRGIRDTVGGVGGDESRQQHHMIRSMADPRRTLELTGPGAFTDECGPEHAGGSEAVVVSHAASARLVAHRGIGTWKKGPRGGN